MIPWEWFKDLFEGFKVAIGKKINIATLEWADSMPVEGNIWDYRNINIFNHKDFEPMQFTGLKDKNGEEIFEGDICKSKAGRVIEIVWDEEILRWSFRVTESGSYVALMFMSLEVIGNIYENKDLLL